MTGTLKFKIIRGDARHLISDCPYCYGTGRAFPGFFLDEEGCKHKLCIPKDGKYEDCPGCEGRGFEKAI